MQIEEHALEERFIRSSGPGGQNVNKVATAVELRYDLRKAGVPEETIARLMTLASKRITADAVLVIDSRAHRTQLRNRDDARARLLALLQQAAIRPKTRRPTKPKAAAREARLQSKKRRSSVKALRSRKDDD